MGKGTMKPCVGFSFNRGVKIESHTDEIATIFIVKIGCTRSLINTSSSRNRNNQLYPP